MTATGKPLPRAHRGTVVKFTDGKYKGFEGLVMKVSETLSSVFIRTDDTGAEVVEENRYLTPLAQIDPLIPIQPTT